MTVITPRGKPAPMSVAGHAIPPEVIEAVLRRMRGGAFTNGELCEVAAEALRACGGPVTTYFSVADRLIQRHRRLGDIERRGEGRDSHWAWKGARPAARGSRPSSSAAA